jgi:hypothetical protein
MSNCINLWLDWLMERGVLRAQIGYIDWLAQGIPRDTPDELWRQFFDGQERLQRRLDELDRAGLFGSKWWKRKG